MRSPPHPPPPALPAAEGSLRKGWRLGPARATVEPKLVRGPPTNFRGGPGQRPGGEGAPRATQDTFRKLGSKLRAPCPLLLPATSGGRSAGVRGEEWGGGQGEGDVSGRPCPQVRSQHQRTNSHHCGQSPRPHPDRVSAAAEGEGWPRDSAPQGKRHLRSPVGAGVGLGPRGCTEIPGKDR